MYKIFTTEEFDKSFEKLDTSIQIMIDNELRQLQENPYAGKPLGYKFFREKKAKNYRVYYLIYEEYVVVFVVAISGKKDQQKAIDKIKLLMPYYKEEIRKKLNL
ncbi:type II toxin-antitoxin system RelE/ParE family toxin [Candidatus Woesearchaeota archaeon]|nr:type II toxin-antitoxin system RelE/ParE family toxin [Candidatus Woesearchaeota archaeon]